MHENTFLKTVETPPPVVIKTHCEICGGTEKIAYWGTIERGWAICMDCAGSPEDFKKRGI